MNALGYLVFRGHTNWQIALTLLMAVLCALPWGGALMERISGRLGRFARRRGWAIVAVFIVSMVLNSTLSLRRGVPLAYVHDEFSYLLAADTFAHGRLTNPTPAAPEHFESMHILVRPTYMSKYPPGQGLALAAGKVLLGHEIAGAWVSTALACAAVCWMLVAFMPPGWALLGGLMFAIHPQILEWAQRYWGGSVAVLGGALILGGVPRILRATTPRAADAIWAAIGALILANTRPFEGAVLAMLLGVGLLVWMFSPQRPPGAVSLSRIIAPALAVLIPGAIWMGYYNWRVTGHALRLPYQEHQAQYATVPLFIFQKGSPEPSYSHLQLRQFHVTEQGYWFSRRDSWSRIEEEAAKNVVRLYEGTLGNAAVLGIPLIVLPWIIWKNRTMRLLVLMLLLFFLALMAETFMYPHYAAPAAGLVAAIELIALRWMWRMDRRVGPLLVRLTVGIFALWAVFWWIGCFSWRQNAGSWQERRDWIANEFLAKKPGKHLILVRYGDHNVHEEWVYNGADIPNSKVIWARETTLRTSPTTWSREPDVEANRKLLEAYKDHHAWLVEPESKSREPVPYPG